MEQNEQGKTEDQEFQVTTELKSGAKAVHVLRWANLVVKYYEVLSLESILAMGKGEDYILNFGKDYLMDKVTFECLGA